MVIVGLTVQFKEHLHGATRIANTHGWGTILGCTSHSRNKQMTIIKSPLPCRAMTRQRLIGGRQVGGGRARTGRLHGRPG